MSDSERVEQLKRARPDLYGESPAESNNVCEIVGKFFSVTVLLLIIGTVGYVGLNNREFFEVGSDKSWKPNIFASNNSDFTSDNGRIRPLWGIRNEIPEDRLDELRKEVSNY